MGGSRNISLTEKEALEEISKPPQSSKRTSLKFQSRHVFRLAPAIYMQYLHILLMQIVEILCTIFYHEARQAASLKFFELAIKVENWQLEIKHFHNRITARREWLTLCPIQETKIIFTTVIPMLWSSGHCQASPWESQTAKGTYTWHQTCRRNKKLQR